MILRHAKSSWKDPTLQDSDRPLKKKGKKAAKKLGAYLVENKLIPEVILSSSAKRALQTSQILIESFSDKVELYDIDIFYGDHFAGGDLIEKEKIFEKFICDFGGQAERLMIVGHNPDMENFLYGFIGKFYEFSPCAMAVVELEIDHWEDARAYTKGKLVDFWEPKPAKDA
jgi:phosphohistidine phosphatase